MAGWLGNKEEPFSVSSLCGLARESIPRSYGCVRVGLQEGSGVGVRLQPSWLPALVENGLPS